MNAMQQPFTVHGFAQRSPEWFVARLGRLTGSRADDATANPLKSGGEPASRRDYRLQLVAERLSGQAQEEVFTTAAMQWGSDHEAEAISVYESLTGNMARTVGFVSLINHRAGCSPDAVVGEWQGLVSIKCPKTATHLSYLREDRLPPAYLPQILCELWCTGAPWVDFFSHDPRMPENLRCFLKRYDRDEDAVAAFEAKALAFLAEVDRDESALRGWSILRDSPGAPV